jgi:hypothetical protein
LENKLQPVLAHLDLLYDKFSSRFIYYAGKANFLINKLGTGLSRKCKKYYSVIIGERQILKFQKGSRYLTALLAEENR